MNWSHLLKNFIFCAVQASALVKTRKSNAMFELSNNIPFPILQSYHLFNVTFSARGSNFMSKLCLVAEMPHIYFSDLSKIKEEIARFQVKCGE